MTMDIFFSQLLLEKNQRVHTQVQEVLSGGLQEDEEEEENGWEVGILTGTGSQGTCDCTEVTKSHLESRNACLFLPNYLMCF